MKLFTKEIDKKLFQQYPYGSDLAMQKVVAKIFNPYGRGTWYILNSDPEDPDYLWAIVDLFGVEMGSVSRTELESIKVKPFGLGLERDLHFTPVNALELFKGLSSGKMYAAGGISDVEVIEKNNEAYLGLSGDDKKRIFVKFEDGGNLDMLKNQSLQFKHHAEELHNVLKNNPKVHAWVVAKAERASTDLSDITHYLEGTTKLADGGQLSVFEKGGDLSNIKPYRYNFDTYIKIEGTNYGGKLVLGSENKSDGSTHKYLSHIEWDENNVPESAEQVEGYVAENLNQLLMDAYKYADGGQIDTEFSNSLKKIKEYRIKKIISIEEADLRDRSHFKGTRVPNEWKNYSVFFVKYIPNIFNGGAYTESMLLFFSNDKQREELIEMLKSFKGGETISKYADGGSVLAEDTVARVDDPLFADLSQYAKGGGLGDERGWWSIEIKEDDNDENISNEEVARLIREGYTSGYYPTWTLKTTIDIGDNQEHIASLVEQGYTSGELINDKFAKGGNLSRDRKFISQQEWEKNYKRKTAGKIYKHEAGGEVGKEKMYEIEFSWKKQSDDDFDSRKVVVMASDINDAVKKVTDKFSSYYEGFEIVEAEKGEEEEEFADGGYVYNYNCVYPSSGYEELEFIIDNMVEISADTFLKNVSLDEINSSLMYGISYNSKNQIKKDWGLSFYKIKKGGIDAYVLKNSGIEYVFKNPERFAKGGKSKMYISGDDLRDKLEAMSDEELLQYYVDENGFDIDDNDHRERIEEERDSVIDELVDEYVRMMKSSGRFYKDGGSIKTRAKSVKLTTTDGRVFFDGKNITDADEAIYFVWKRDKYSDVLYDIVFEDGHKLSGSIDLEPKSFHAPHKKNILSFHLNTYWNNVAKTKLPYIPKEFVESASNLVENYDLKFAKGGVTNRKNKILDEKVKNAPTCYISIYNPIAESKVKSILDQYGIKIDSSKKWHTKGYGKVYLNHENPKEYPLDYIINLLDAENPIGLMNDLDRLDRSTDTVALAYSKYNVMEDEYLESALSNPPFQIGEIVWDSKNQSYGVVLDNYKGFSSDDVRLDSDGNQPVKNLHKLGSKGDKGSKYKLIGALLAHKRLVDEYGYDTVKYAKGGKVPDKKVADIRLRVQKFLRPLGYEAIVTEEHDFILIEPSTRKVGDKRKDYFDGMQIIRDSDGTYEVSEYQAGENQNELHIYKKTKSLLLALKDLIKGNKRKPIKIYK